MNLWWLWLMTALSLKCFLVTPRIISSIILRGTEVRLTGLLLPEYFFLPILKIGTKFASFRSTETSQDSKDCWKNNRETSHDNTGQIFKYHGINPIGPYRYAHSAREASSGLAENLSSLQSQSSNTGLQGLQDPSSVLKTEVKRN